MQSPDGAVAAALGPLAGDVAERLDRFDVTGALERIWEVVRALNRESSRAAPWQLAKDDARADELDRVLYDLVDGLRVVAITLAAYVPETSPRSSRRCGSRRALDWSLAAYGLSAGRRGSSPPRRCSRGSSSGRVSRLAP